MPSNNPAYETPADVLDSHTPPAEPGSQEPPAEIFQAPSPTTGQPSTPGLPAPVVDDPFAEYGGVEAVRQRQAAVEAWGTEEGLTVAAVEALRGLGFERDVIESLFNWEAEEEPDPLADVPDDEPLTKEQMRAWMEREIERRVRPVEESFEESQERQRFEQATHAAVGALQALGVQDDATKQGVITLAQAYIAPDEWDPEVIANAVRRGHADWNSIVQAEAEKYLLAKQGVRDSLPRNIGGHSQSPGEVTQPTARPKSLDDAMRQVREKAKAEGWWQQS